MYLIVGLAVVLGIIAIYGFVRIVIYSVKMVLFYGKLKKNKIELNHSLFSIIFGKKGRVNFTVSTSNGEYAVSIITNVSTHGRWNIEKARYHYYFEARRQSFAFYNEYKNTGTEPEHSKEYRREYRVSRTQLHLPPATPNAKSILLFHPKPKELTYTDNKLTYLYRGSMIDGYEVMFADDFFDLMK